MRNRMIGAVSLGFLAGALTLATVSMTLAETQAQWRPGGWGPAGMMGGPWTMGPAMTWGYGATPAPGGGWTSGLAIGLGWLATLALLAALIVGVVLLVRGLSSEAGGSGGVAEEAALDVLKRRYVAGEISDAEYEEEVERALT